MTWYVRRVADEVPDYPVLVAADYEYLTEAEARELARAILAVADGADLVEKGDEAPGVAVKQMEQFVERAQAALTELRREIAESSPPPRDFPPNDFAIHRSHGALRRWDGRLWRWESINSRFGWDLVTDDEQPV